ncbi:NUDIX hydrolase [Candidatus Dojkabacteria bacterium]|uniref:NUDIX hydrolase n=1 Tax=Candidatus Dojkabacteria bacterium TaxID=2099670 RepID=A0A955RKP1_9BACT|nr:NUDIX hydrolase [Candidatus Dojkabacteria bacterium]
MTRTQLVVASFIIHEKKLLIVRRSKKENFFPGVYELPGGKVDFGENPIEAVIRECKEETNLDITVIDPYFVFDYMSKNDSQHNVEIHFLVDLHSAPDDLILTPGHDDFAWVDTNELYQYRSDITDQLWESMTKGFEVLNKSQ